MTKEVLLTIKGLQFTTDAGEEENGSPEPMEVITAGNYYKKNGKHYIMYDEVMEGYSQVTKNIIKINADTLDITKKGVTNVHMSFERNKKNLTYYHTPYGNIMMGIDAYEVKVKEAEDAIQVEVEYGLDFNYEHVADCNIKLNICSKGAEEFRLMD